MDVLDMLANSVENLGTKFEAVYKELSKFQAEISFLKGHILTMWVVLLSLFGTIVGYIFTH